MNVKQSQELRQKIAEKTKAMGGLLEKVATESRAYSEDESKQKETLKKEIQDLEARAEDAEFIESRAQVDAGADTAQKVASVAGGNPTGGSERREQSKIASGFRLTRAIGRQLLQKPLEGMEAEVHQEAEKEARAFGKAIEGFAVPSWAMAPERRDALVGTDANAGDTVGTSMIGFIESLRPNPTVFSLGAVNMDGLMSNIEIPRQTGNTVASWKTEQAEAGVTDAAFDKVTMIPKRLTAVTEASRQLMLQSTVPVSFENLLRSDLRRSHELALDLAAINGSGSDPVPEGVLNTTGIGAVALDTNGAVLTRAALIALIRTLDVENVDFANLSFLGNPQVRAELMNTLVDAGSGRFLMENASSGILGYNAAFTTQVPSNLTKGSGTALSALIFGNFREMMIGTWGGMDVIADPYSKATSGMVRLITHGFHDIAVRQPKAFAAIKDINTSATA
jgi:HK97 family phage major capsid protein